MDYLHFRILKFPVTLEWLHHLEWLQHFLIGKLLQESHWEMAKFGFYWIATTSITPLHPTGDVFNHHVLTQLEVP